MPSYAWEESTGLLSSLVPQSGSKKPDPAAFNASKGDLKLGPAPIDETLRAEANRVIREQVLAGTDPELGPMDQSNSG